MATSNPFDVALKGQSVNPFDAALGGVRSLSREAEGVAHGALDLLDRPRQTVQAGIAGKDWKHVLIHGETQGESDANRASLRHRLGLDDPTSLLGRTGTYSNAHPVARGLVDTLLDTVTDPTSLLGGLGAGKAVFEHAAEHAAPAAIRAFSAARNAAPVGSRASRVLGKVGDIGEKLSDITTPGGATSAALARTLAEQTGSNRTYQQLYALRNVYDTNLQRFTEKFGAKQGRELALKWLGRQIKQNHPSMMNGAVPMQDVVNFFTKAHTGDSNALLKASALSKGTLFWNPIPHMKNIATLTALADPTALAGALKKSAQLAGADVWGRLTHNDALREQVMKQVLGKATIAGASHVKNMEQSQMIRAMQSIPGVGKALSKPYEVAGRALWGFDDAAKAAVYESNLRRFKDPGVAAYHTLHQLVDYSHQSPMVAKLRYAMPFATWRNRMPAAVMRSLIENPQNVLGLNRLTGGMAAGGTVPGANGTALAESTPLEQGLQLDPIASAQQLREHKIPDIAKYLRGSLGPSADTALGMGVNVLSGNKSGANAKTFMTDWAHPIDFLLSRLPVAGQIQALSGHGIFKDTPKEELLYQLFGLETRKP